MEDPYVTKQFLQVASYSRSRSISPHNSRHKNYQNQNFNGNNQNRNNFPFNKNTDRYYKKTNNKTGPNGTVYRRTSSNTNDAEQGYKKSTEELKHDRLSQLGSDGITGTLQGIKKPNKLRIFITGAAPNTPEAEIEYYLLEKFPDVIKAIVRKQKCSKINIIPALQL